MIAAWVLLAGALVHAHLVSSVPGDGESLAASPPVIRLVFSEPGTVEFVSIPTE